MYAYVCTYFEVILEYHLSYNDEFGLKFVCKIKVSTNITDTLDVKYVLEFKQFIPINYYQTDV